ncbi:MAG: hypothetical protein ACRBBV_17265 [Paracoccaceae bacterium]
MTDYAALIATCEADTNALRHNLKEAHRLKGKSAHHHELWKRSAAAFREYNSPLYDLVAQCLRDGLLHDDDLRRFAFAYIDQDPYFFRSGYMLESILQRVKKLSLSPTEKASLQRLLLNRIENAALRSFRRICQLIPMIDSDPLREAVRDRARSTDPSVKRRAEFALRYFPTGHHARA